MTDLVKRLRAYITADDDEMAPINRTADYMLVEEAAARIEKLEKDLSDIADALMYGDTDQSPPPVEQATNGVGSNHGDEGEYEPYDDIIAEGYMNAHPRKDN